MDHCSVICTLCILVPGIQCWKKIYCYFWEVKKEVYYNDAWTCDRFIMKIMQVLSVPVIFIPVFSKLSFHKVTCVSKVLSFSQDPVKRLLVVWYVLGGVGQCTINIFKLRIQHCNCIHLNFIWVFRRYM